MRRFLYIAAVLLFLYQCRTNLVFTTEDHEEDLTDAQQKDRTSTRIAGTAPSENGERSAAEAGTSMSEGGVPRPAEWTRFAFPEPSATSKESLKLWATYYYTPVFKTSAKKSYAIRGQNEESILGNEGLTKQEWCSLALQGSSIIVTSLGIKYTISFTGRSTVNRIDCSDFIQSKEISAKVAGNRFRFSHAIFGTGARSDNVIPFRTIAVDPSFIPYGSVLYIPRARGATFLDGNARRTHDGYFFAGDTGSAILGNHIDVFIGTNYGAPFDFVKSSSNGLFQAYVVDDLAISKTLSTLHGFQY